MTIAGARFALVPQRIDNQAFLTYMAMLFLRVFQLVLPVYAVQSSPATFSIDFGVNFE